MTPPGHALITGATGQLGEAVARLLAARGWSLSLTALEAGVADLAAVLDAGPGGAEARALDIQDAAALGSWIEVRHAERPFDRVILNAGLGGPVPDGGVIEPAERCRQLVAVNLVGVLNALQASLPLLQAQGRGRIVLLGSLSALVGYPRAPVYAATKAALRALALSLHPGLRAQGIGLTLASPGFLASPMADGRGGWRPFAIGPEQAALRIVEAAARGRAEASFPLPMALFVRGLALLPIGLREAVYRLASK